MDETLIHCLGTRKFTEQGKKVNEDGVELTADNADVVTWGMSMSGNTDRWQYFNIRPYAMECLKELSKDY